MYRDDPLLTGPHPTYILCSVWRWIAYFKSIYNLMEKEHGIYRPNVWKPAYILLSQMIPHYIYSSRHGPQMAKRDFAQIWNMILEIYILMWECLITSRMHNRIAEHWFNETSIKCGARLEATWKLSGMLWLNATPWIRTTPHDFELQGWLRKFKFATRLIHSNRVEYSMSGSSTLVNYLFGTMHVFLHFQRFWSRKMRPRLFVF